MSSSALKIGGAAGLLLAGIAGISSVLKSRGSSASSGSGAPVGKARDFQLSQANDITALGANTSLLSNEDSALVAGLIAAGQGHLFEGWAPKGTDDKKKKELVAQLRKLDESYPSGGIVGYINNAKKLLADSKAGVNPFDGFNPSVPAGENLTYGNPAFKSLETVGIEEAKYAAFVLVAGGLGERLGYSGIKIALPSESTSGSCFLKLYIESIMALEASSQVGSGWMGRRKIPLVIMTSDDTHAATLKLLEDNRYFGMTARQVTLVKQEKVACLEDNDARLALSPKNPYEVLMKPHGHGDVHALLYSSGLVQKFKEDGVKWVCFFQDTNGLVFKALPAALGVSVKSDMDVNSLAVPRKAGEAIGAITKLQHKDGRSMTINVEYNQLDPLLRATPAYAKGDVNDPATNFSPFPGNINQLILKIDPYINELTKTSGVISEFVNPKYKDATKTAFKSPTRLECMMQDFPKTLPASANVGFTVVNPTTAAYSPVKNSPADALAKSKGGSPSHSATSGELELYEANCNMLHLAGAQVGEAVPKKYNGISLHMHPAVVISPAFGITVDQIKNKINGFAVVIEKESSLVLDGRDIEIKSLRLKGALTIKAINGAKVVVNGLTVDNKGWEYKALTEAEKATCTEEEMIRGFRVIKHDTASWEFTEPGTYMITA